MIGKIIGALIQHRIKAAIITFLFINVAGFITFSSIEEELDINRESENYVINIGEMLSMSISPSMNPNQRLVPIGTYKGVNDIDQYVFEYEVLFDKAGTLVVDIDPDDIKIGDGNHGFNTLFVIQIFVGETPNHLRPILYLTETFEEDKQNFLNIKIRVFIVAPQDETEYDEAYQLLKGQTTNFVVTISLIGKE